jgi:DNA-binding response OmpR family regulator
MRDAIRSDRSPMGVLRATLASLGFGRKSNSFGNAEQWTAPIAKLSVTIHAAANGAPASRTFHRIGNLQVFELPPGATVDGRFFRLSPTEFSIILKLARAKERFVSFAELSQSDNGGAGLTLGALSVHVYGLRRKLTVNHADARVTTKRALGYKLSAAGPSG